MRIKKIPSDIPLSITRDMIESVKVEKIESIKVTGIDDGSGDIKVAKEDAAKYLRSGYYLKEEHADGQVTLAKKVMIKYLPTIRPIKLVIKVNQQTGERLQLTEGEIRRFTRGSRFNLGYDWEVDSDYKYTFTPKSAK